MDHLDADEGGGEDAKDLVVDRAAWRERKTSVIVKLAGNNYVLKFKFWPR